MMPSPVCFTSRPGAAPTYAGRCRCAHGARPCDRRLPIPCVCATESADVGEDDGPHRWLRVRRADRVCRERSQQRVQRRGGVELDDRRRELSVSFLVDRDDGMLARALGQTEDRASVGIEPVRAVVDAELLLDLRVEPMGLGEFLRRHARRIVTVEIHGHALSVSPAPPGAGLPGAPSAFATWDSCSERSSLPAARGKPFHGVIEAPWRTRATR